LFFEVRAVVSIQVGLEAIACIMLLNITIPGGQSEHIFTIGDPGIQVLSTF